MFKHASARRGLIVPLVAAVVTAPLAVGLSVTPAMAAPSTGLVISEVYGGGGNSGAQYTNDFIELYNPTASAISVAGMSVQYRSATGNTAALTNLTGSVPAGGYYLIQEAAGATPSAALPTPDATGTLAMSGANGVVILASNTTAVTAVGNFAGSGNPANVIDTVGYGTTPTTFEGTNTGVALTNTTSAQRAANGADTDANAPDFSEAAPTPTNSQAAPSGALAATNPGNKTGTVGQPISGFTLTATGGTSPYTFAATGLPGGVTVATNGAVSGTPTAAGTFNVTATATDSASPAATANTQFTFTISAAPATQNTIAEIQGTNTDTTPFAGQVVTTTGVVTASFPTGGLNGFYIQTGGPDTTPDASDGIFVFGGAGFTGYPTVGTTVTVTGTAKEFVTNSKNQTEIDLTTAGSSVATAATAQPAVVAKTVVPGTDCAQGSCPTAAELAAAREKVESELFAPAGAYTVTDPYDGSPFPSTSSANFGEIGLAADTKPLVQPTEVYDTQTQAGQLAALTTYNNSRRIILDDGSSTNYTTAANTGLPLPWFTASHYVRVGAGVTFPQPVVLTEQFDGWTFLPSGGQVVGDSTGKVDFEQNRPAAPTAVGGDIKLGTANVLNYFPTTGEEFAAAAAGNTCTYYNDRAGNPITNNTCNPNGPRGAANAANLTRQQDKIVRELNTLGADIVALEEIENSVKLGKNRDFAVSALVDALNADAGAGTWAFAPSPAAANLPTVAQQDVIRNAFIYKPAKVTLVGPSRVLSTESSDTTSPTGAFANAREPLAQGFKGVGQANSRAFTVITNHFKSKSTSGATGDNLDTGQGGFNADRIRQANALMTFAQGFSDNLGGSGAIFLTGDFNSYEQEDPIQVLTSGGYTALDSTTTPGESSYSFSGLSGSLDHVLANSKANAMVTGVDIWNINADESVYYEYSRFNYNVTNLYTNDQFRASDHNPEVVGITLDPTPITDVQILATNDFHGRIQNDTTTGSAGAAVLAGAVKQFKAANPATSFVAAGDLIGASTFESFIAKDKPTIDALNEAGLDVSAVGNHEFDQGYNDLINRVMAPYDANTNPYGGAEWKYIGANVKLRDSGNPALDPSYVMNQGGVQVGYIGAVTEHLPELVSPGGISNIQVTDIVTAVNTEAATLKAAGAKIIVLLVHEGAAGTSCATIASDTTSDFGKITAGVSADVDAIVSGHTHLTYNCSLPVAAWASQGRAVTERPVVSAGQYGTNLNQIVYSVNSSTGAIASKFQAVLPLKNGTTGSTYNYPVDSATQTIVTNAVQQADVLGAQVIGKIAGPFNRAKLADGTTENRGGESTLGNLVAEIQRAQTASAQTGSAQIAFMNPGGLRADLAGTVNGASRDVTYKQAATVQPFANTLVNEALTGAQIKAALEQQWQPAGASRPFLKLGISKGFSYTYDPSAAQGSRIKTMTLNGVAIDPAATYSVTVNSFLSTGGDNFTALNGTARKQDTGVTDLQAQVDYFAALGTTTPAPVDYAQRAVGVSNVTAKPTAGQNVTFTLSSLAMTGPGDVADTQVSVSLDGALLGTAPVTTTLQTALPGYDEVGTASVMVPLPSGISGAKSLVVAGNNTGTVTQVPITVRETVDVQILATNDFHGRIQNDTSSGSAGAAVLAGAVKQFKAANPATSFVAAGDLIGASTFESFIAKDKPTIDALNEAGLDVSAVGNHEFDQGYNDLVNRVMAPYNASTNPYGGANWKYLGANVKFRDSGNPALDGSWIKDQDGIQVGYIGAVTEHLPEFVSPGGISNIQVTNIVTAANTEANALKAAGADVVVLLVHEGAAGTSCATIASDTTSDFGKITAGVNDNIDAIVSGHTHLTYNCSLPVPGWSGRAVTERPVVSAGQYGTNLNQIIFKVNVATGVVLSKTQALLPLKNGTTGSTFNYPVDANTQTIVTNAVQQADVLGAQVIGKIGGAFNRAKLSDGTTENRGGESTLGNLVAEIQRAQTASAQTGSAQIAFMNPGGLRADLVGTVNGASRDITYKQAATVQPFANTLVNEALTGAQIKAALEQQWQPAGASRPFLKLGISKGFSYTYDPNAAAGSRIKTMTLNGSPIVLTDTYSVTVNSFLSTGGDNFTALNGAARKQDTGVTDLQAQVDYFAALGTSTPAPVDYSQRAVGVTGLTANPTGGQNVSFTLSSLSMTGPGDVTDTSVTVTMDGATLGTAPVTTTVTPAADEAGTASVMVPLPSTASGAKTLVVTGNNTGTVTRIPITVTAGSVNVQILATNDFHGRIQNDTSSGSAGAAVLAGAVKQFKAANPATSFVAAGDLIGASTFESFIAKDKPTIDALNEAGLDVSAVGNHEFDQGYNDLVNRVMAPYNASTNPYGGANWKYIGANVKFRDSGSPALDPSFVMNQGGVQVGYIGAVTEHLPELVSPGGISNIQVTDIVTAVNTEANTLKAAGADLIVLLVHEGAAGTSCATIGSDTTSDFGKITAGVNANVDAIVSGHTHLTYNCSLPVAAWASQGRAVTERPVVSAGQYGTNLNQIVYTVDPATGVASAKTQALLPLKNGTTGSTFNYPVDSATQTIVNNAVTNADTLGAVVIGKIGGAFNRAKLADGTTENRGGESTLGNLVAEIQRAQTASAQTGSAQIAFMNPGGLRADLVGTVNGASRDVTYKQAATVQPFANTLVNEALTGAQIKAALEQQWQPTGSSRPFLKLGISKGFSYTYDPNAAQGSRIQTMSLNGTPIDLAATYSVTVNSFLSTGGDNFTALNGTARKQDTGVTDLQAQVDYFAALGTTTPAPVDYSQRAVGVRFPSGSSTFKAGTTAAVNLSSLSMTGPGDTKDTTVVATIDGTNLGSFPVTSTLQTALPGFDEVGTATTTAGIPRSTTPGAHTLVFTGNNTGTVVRVPVTVTAPDPVATTVAGTAADVPNGQDAVVNVTVSSDINTGAAPSGTVTVLDGTTTVATGTLSGGQAAITVPAAALEPGDNAFTLSYAGDTDHRPSTGSVTVTVTDLATSTTATAPAYPAGEDAVVHVVVDATASDLVPGGQVLLFQGADQVGSVVLSAGEGDITVPSDLLSIGDNPFSASYQGQPGFAPSSSTFTITVTKAVAEVTGSPTSITYGEMAAIPVAVGPTVGDVAPSGTVALKNGTTLLGSATLGSGATGVVTLDALALPAGSYDLTLEYSGDDTYTADTGAVTLTVAKAASATSASVAPSTVVVKKDRNRVTATVTAAGYDPTGTVRVVVNGTSTFSGQLVGGVATIPVGPWQAVGTFDVAVDYLGDANTLPSADAVQVRVTKQTPSLTITAPASVKKGTRPTVRAVVTGVGGVVTGRVQFQFSGKTVVRTLSNGRATFTLPKVTRKTVVGVRYLGTGVYNPVVKFKTIQVKK